MRGLVVLLLLSVSAPAFACPVGQPRCDFVTGLDLAADRSPPAGACTAVRPLHNDVRDEPLGFLFAFLIFITSLTTLGVIALRSGAARNAGAHKPLVPIAIDLVRQVALAHRRRAERTLAISGGVLVLLANTGNWGLAMMLGTVPFAFALASAVKAHRMRRLLRTLEAPECSTSYDGSEFAFTSDRQWIALDRYVLARFAIPQAKIR